MTLKDKLEIGLKEDAPYRKDNLPAKQVRGPQVPKGPDRSPEVPAARADKNKTPRPKSRPVAAKPRAKAKRSTSR